MNFPAAEHYQADITTLPIDRMPWCHLFTASPACPSWTTANGLRRDFDRVNAEPTLFDLDRDDSPKTAKRREEYKRSRLLMREIPRYLRAQAERGRPVPIGWMENVIQCRLWNEWDTWIDEIHKLGYQTRVIALNSMHAQPVRTKWAPQSRDRLYLAFWHRSIGRTPDWDKWLRPRAWCPTCGTTVAAMQVFKRRDLDMGRHGSQYAYRCPNTGCRHAQVHPEVLPAAAIIDPTIMGVRIGDRVKCGMPVLAQATMDRIATGVRKYWLPLLVPVEGRPGKMASPATAPLRTQTCRNETGIALPPLVMRNNTPRRDECRCTPVGQPLRTVTAQGTQSLLTAPDLLVPYYGNTDSAVPASDPIGTLTTRDRYGLARLVDASILPTLDFDDVLFRMLEVHEIAAAMAFPDGYRTVAASKRTRVRLYGNAVTPPAAEVITSALVECLTGEDLPREVAA